MPEEIQRPQEAQGDAHGPHAPPARRRPPLQGQSQDLRGRGVPAAQDGPPVSSSQTRRVGRTRYPHSKGTKAGLAPGAELAPRLLAPPCLGAARWALLGHILPVRAGLGVGPGRAWRAAPWCSGWGGGRWPWAGRLPCGGVCSQALPPRWCPGGSQASAAPWRLWAAGSSGSGHVTAPVPGAGDWSGCSGRVPQSPWAVAQQGLPASACVCPQGAILTTMLATRNFSGENRLLQGGSGWPATSRPPRTPSAPSSAAGLTCLTSDTRGEAWAPAGPSGAPQEAARHEFPRLSGLCVP